MHAKTYLSLILAAVFYLLPDPALALTIYRIGGADLPPPGLETEYEFVQLAWEDADPANHGQSDLIELHPDHIIPQTMNPQENLTPRLEALGGRILILEWNGWQQWRDDDILIFDGDPETAYLGDGHTHRFGTYKRTVNRAVLWLKRNQQDDGTFGAKR